MTAATECYAASRRRGGGWCRRPAGGSNKGAALFFAFTAFCTYDILGYGMYRKVARMVQKTTEQQLRL
ncbi:hypothetical protein DIPPA_57195 [Diplonema papillatum]|nr:hypothetical protein DIPPA_57195 [Diplonema papillatum]